MKWSDIDMTFWSSVHGGMSEATPVGPLALQVLSLWLSLHRWNCSVYGRWASPAPTVARAGREQLCAESSEVIAIVPVSFECLVYA